MKKDKKLLILVGCLILMIGAILLVKGLDLENGLKTNGDEIDSGERIFEIDDVKNLSWDYDGISYSFLKEDGKWVYEEDPEYRLDETKIENIVTYLKKASSDIVIENVEDLKEYGLNNTDKIFKINDYNVKIGKENSVGGKYYLTFNDVDVYLIDTDIDGYFDDNLSYYFLKDTLPSSIDFKDMTVKTSDDSFKIIYSLENHGYSDQFSYYLVDGSDYIALDTDYTETYIEVVSYFSIGEMVNYKNDVDLSKYGLDNPQGHVLVNYVLDDENQTIEYDVGKNKDSYYVRFKDSNIIYSITATTYSNIAEKDINDLLPAEVMKLDFSNAKKITINMDNETYVFNKETTLIFKTVSWHYENNEIDTEELFDELNNLSVNYRSDELKVDKALELSVEIELENKETVSFKAYKFTGTNSICEFNGDLNIVVLRSKIVNLKEVINDIVLG